MNAKEVYITTATLVILFSVLFFTATAISSELPPGTKTKGEAMDGYLYLSAYDENGVTTTSMMLFATCDKTVPFQIEVISNDEWPPIGTILPEYLNLTYVPDISHPCASPADVILGLAILKAKNCINTGETMICNVTLQPVVPDPK